MHLKPKAFGPYRDFNMKKVQGVFIKNARELENLREANRLTANVLDAIGDEIRPGIPTMHLENIARELCQKWNVRPAFLGYQGFPYAICCSVNEVVVHGFPSNDRILQKGDVVSVDFGIEYGGMVGDSARTFAVGEISETADRLLYVTEASLFEGIAHALAGHDVHEVGAAVQRFVEDRGFGVVRRFVGHGVGAQMHEKPEVPNFHPGTRGVTLQHGMSIAIEPMVTEGTYEVEILPDRWTAVTRDRKLAAHFEQSIAITSHGPQILSIGDRGLYRYKVQYPHNKD